MEKYRRVSCVVTLALAAASAVPAWAAQGQNEAVAGTGAEELQEVTVTGSRVITNGNDSPTPVTVIQASELDSLRPGTLADGLNSLPVFSGSNSQINVGNPTGAFSGGNNTANTLNLRNLGALRTLMLFNGQRLVPTLTLGSVDVNMVPQMLIQRVDIVTGGASAVYGSDAVSGVVNFVIDRNFNGIKADVNAGMSVYNDDRSYRVGVAAGTPLFGGRGHIEGSYNYYDNQGIDLRTDRPYFFVAAEGSVQGSTAAAGSAANPLQVFRGVHNAQTSFGGLISNGVLSGMTFDSNGVLTPFTHGVKTGTTNEEIGGDGAYNNVQLVGPLQSNQFYGRFDFDVSDDLRWHSDVVFNTSNGSNVGITNSLNPFTFSAQNPFLAATYQATLAAANQTSFQLRKTFPQGFPYPQLVARETQYQFNTGLEGKVGSYDWGVDLNYGASKLENTINNNFNQQNLAAALDVINVNGTPTCRALATNPGCVPFNAFGPTAASQAAINYVTGSTNFIPHWFMADGNAHIGGAPFDDWAGPVKTALSAEWRQLTYSSSTSPGANPSTFANCTGILFNCTQGTTTLWQSTYAARAPVSNSVKEGAIEFDAPLLKDLPMVKELDLNGAARYTSYETSGNYWTWKIGLEWHMTDSLTLRNTTSRDIAAPTLYDLFRPEVDVPVAVTDYLLPTASSSYNAPSRDLPAPNDTAEIALTRTLGMVWQPSANFSASLDAFRIRIDNAIGQIQGFNQQVQLLCYSSPPNGPVSPFCSLQQRPSGCFSAINPACTVAANQVTGWLNFFENISVIETYGADLELNWSGRAFDHRINARLLGTYQPHYLYGQPGQPTYDLADVAFPKVIGQSNAPSIRLTGVLTVGVTDHFTVNLEERWRNAMVLDELTQPAEYWVPGPGGDHLASYGYTTLNMQYNFDQRWGGLTVYGNIRNLFNTPAPIGQTGNQPGNGFANFDDVGVIGRYYTLGARVKL
jgi:outer membrane receptor protein involved in Fe transport